jgi:hypothetical protein
LSVDLAAFITDVFSVESCYERAEEFIPERWYSNPDMIKNKAGYAPFSLGMLSFSSRIVLATDTCLY